MVSAAERAGKVLVRSFGEIEKLQVAKKGPADFVREADRRAEETLYRELLKARPKYGFITEERDVISGEDTSNTWIVDPLDGTLNFLHGLPHFCVSIALQRDAKIFAGVIITTLALFGLSPMDASAAVKAQTVAYTVDN